MKPEAGEPVIQRGCVGSTTDLVEFSLVKMVTDDEFGAKLAARRGTVPLEIVLEP